MYVCASIINELSVALHCTSIAAPVSEIRSLKVGKLSSSVTVRILKATTKQFHPVVSLALHTNQLLSRNSRLIVC